MAADAGATVASTDRTWLRWSGVAFVVLFLVGWIMVSFTWDDAGDDRQILDWYAESGNRVRQVAGAYVMAFAALAFVAFGQRLHRLLAPSRHADLVRTLAAIFTTLLLVAVVMIVGTSAALQFGDYPDFESAELLRMVENLGFGLVLLPGMIVVGAMAVATSLAARGTGALPPWLVVAGYAVGAVLIVLGPLYFTLILLLLWVLLVALTAGGRWTASLTTG